ncbi:neprilysin-2-like [Diaphorina citri]|uniref:Neprilysin-2-like n=1 Tax=Diaphorina citri TaxID=121845 RepID=A0A3Q0JGR7_DIACI|nr:neprilysin-2-like [Diaphorina citri]
MLVRLPWWSSDHSISLINWRANLNRSALYVRKYFNQDAKANVGTMVRLILDETYKYLSTVDWMDPTTRLAAQDKVKAIIPYVAYPQELLDDSKLEQYYASMDANISSYLDFARAVSKHKR